MSDLISRQAAIDEIRRCRFVVDAIEKISKLPSAQPEQPRRRGEWISATEKPEVAGEYLCEYKVEGMTFHHVLYYWVDDEIWGTGWHSMGNPLDSLIDHTQDMIAWMPLPEPYKEGEADAVD